MTPFKKTKFFPQLLLLGLLAVSLSSAFGELWIPLGSDLEGGPDDENFSRSVSINADGTTLAVGAPELASASGPSGIVRVFTWNNGAWETKGSDIQGKANEGEEFGYVTSISADGNRVAVGAPSYSSDSSSLRTGQVRVFDWNGSDWVQAGNSLDAEAEGDYFGNAVSLSADGNRLAVSAPFNADNGNPAGHMRIYEWSGTDWVQLGSDIDGGSAFYFGWDISLSGDGNRVAAGATFANLSRVFEWNGSAWVQLGIDIPGENFGAAGWSVSLDQCGARLAVGDYANSGNGYDAGHTRIYEWSGTAWDQLGEDIDGVVAGDQSGFAVSLSADGNLVAIGANLNEGDGRGIGHTRVFQMTEGAWVQLGRVIDDFGAWRTVLSSDGNRLAVGDYFNTVRVLEVVPEDFILTFDLGENASHTGGGTLRQYIEDGNAAIAPTVAPDANWAFMGWDWLFDIVVTDLDITAHIEADSDADGLGDGRELVAFGNLSTADDLTDIDDDGVDDITEMRQGRNPAVNENTAGILQEAYLKRNSPWDWSANFGASVDVDGNTAVVGAPSENFGSGAVYVYTRNGQGQWFQSARLVIPNTEEKYSTRGFFGQSVGIDGDTIVVGAPFDDDDSTGIQLNAPNQRFKSSGYDSGAVHVFVRDANGNWIEQAYIKASNADQGDEFGLSVGISGDTIVVGAPNEDSTANGVNGSQSSDSESNAGAAYVFTRSGTTWTQQAYLKASNSETYDLFGDSVVISGDIIAVGAIGEDSAATGVNGDGSNNLAVNSGAAYVFTRNSADTWFSKAYLKRPSSDKPDFFGSALALDDGTLVVGSEGEAYVFTDIEGSWFLRKTLTASNAEPYYSADPFDFFGHSVAISGDTIVIGATLEDSSSKGIDGSQLNNNADNAGAAYVFTGTGSNWTQEAYLKASNTDPYDEFGFAVAISGDTVLVSANMEQSASSGFNPDPSDNSGGNVGAAYLFNLNYSPPPGPPPGPSSYTVTFHLGVHGDRTGGGELIQTIDYGEAASAPVVSPHAFYFFTGWDVAFENITGVLTVTAQYAVDTDRDGISDPLEALLGTDPNDRNDRFRLSISKTADGEIQLSYHPHSEQVNVEIERSFTLDDPDSWQVVCHIFSPSGEEWGVILPTATEGAVFYRARISAK